ncbi:hypothetical protein Hypma_003555 [Hypsizygus marmoreus]|uniref:Uncharacterized protein n=1 Tax=Hypsizygus marmoreus TaxID=39966 RepID=A0A369JAT4_HYPMA|nr:hypothetical protein Hypma_003555 [Hypsizygus marmoreus]
MASLFPDPDDEPIFSQDLYTIKNEEFSQDFDPYPEASQCSREIKQESMSQEIPPPSTLERDQVEEFFRWRPDTLEPAQNGGHTKSTGTRAPGEFDRHLHEDLILHHVVHVPSITSDLRRIAEDALHAHYVTGTLPPILPDTLFPTSRARVSALASSVVGATLAYQLPEWSPDCLEWTLTDVGEDPKSKAIADGFLSVVSRSKSGQRLSLSDLQQIVAETFPVIAVWEFKSLAAGDPAIIAALSKEFVDRSRFPWEGCPHKKLCAFKHPGDFVVPTGSKMGLDAEIPPCPSIGPARAAADLRRSAGPIPDHPGTVGFIQKARWIVQQVWAEAVVADATFMVIHSGNVERIGIRDRKNQTLYLSDVIRVDACEYGKLQTGLYIAAIRGAEQRALLLKRQPVAPQSYTRTFKQTADTTKMDLEQASSRDWLVMAAQEQNARNPQMHVPFFSNFIYRRVDLSNPNPAPAVPTSHTYFRIQVYSSFDDVISRGILYTPGPSGKLVRHSDGAVVIKNALGTPAVTRLRSEYEVYLALHKAGVTGIPEIIGYFKYANLEAVQSPPLYAALVLEDRGQSVDELLNVEPESDGPLLSKPKSIDS